MTGWRGPGEGWRKEPYRDDLANDFPAYVYYFDGEAGTAVTWVPGKPVPPLPTAPYTVIRVTWKDTGRKVVLTLGDDGMWLVHANITNYRNATEVMSQMVGFEVLAEPPLHIVFKQDEEHDAEVRRETAEAVLRQLFTQMQADGKVPGHALSEAMREFGVTS